jgi:Uma2 family endonuclease
VLALPLKEVLVLLYESEEVRATPRPGAKGPLSWPEVLEIWRNFDVPDGWRLEVTREGITMTPGPAGAHHLAAHQVNRALVNGVAPSCGVFHDLDIAAPEYAAIWRPDLCVVPLDAVPLESRPVNSRDVVLAVEITSPWNAENDREHKHWAYATGHVAHYLLIDPFDKGGPIVRLYSRPEDALYREERSFLYGQVVELPDPLGLTIDTRTFPAAGPNRSR